jgi:hypothetical protein
MQDQDFEKQVQEKLDTIRFSPSESVWSGVERRIRKDRRRNDPLFWLFLALGIALTGSLYGLFILLPSKQPMSTAEKTTADKARPASPVTQNRMRAGAALQKNGGRNNGNTSANGSPAVPGLSDNSLMAPEVPEKNSAGRRQVPGVTSFLVQHPPGLTERGPLEAQPPAIKDLPPIALLAAPQNGGSYETTPAALTGLQPRAEQKAKSTAPAPSKKKHWYWGIGIATGISNTYEEFLNNSSTGAPNYIYNPSAPVRYYSPSKIKPGFSIDAGLFAERVLCSRFSLKGGLRYHYFSNTIETGAHSDSAVTVYTYSTTTFVTNGYYSNGNEKFYTNQYHFIEVPVSLQYRIMQKGKIMLFTDAGVSVGQMIATNALHFDNSTGAYYQKISLFNKTQLSATLGVNAGFYSRRSLIQAGPEVQYGLTNMLAGSSANQRHLFFAGLKMVLTPAKK